MSAAGLDGAPEQGVTEACDIVESGAGLDSADRPDVPDNGDIALSRDVTGNRDMPCPGWCVEHYQGEGVWNHSSYPETVIGADVCTGAPMELGYWVERRDDPDVQETVVVLEVSKLAGDIELTPDALRVFATRLIGLANRSRQ